MTAADAAALLPSPPPPGGTAARRRAYGLGRLNADRARSHNIQAAMSREKAGIDFEMR